MGGWFIYNALSMIYLFGFLTYLLPIIGLSCKTQELYLIVFCVRYLDLFMYYISMYNTLMKLFYISSTAFIIYLMRYKKPYCTVSHWRNMIIIWSNNNTSIPTNTWKSRVNNPSLSLSFSTKLKLMIIGITYPNKLLKYNTI